MRNVIIYITSVLQRKQGASDQTAWISHGGYMPLCLNVIRFRVIAFTISVCLALTGITFLPCFSQPANGKTDFTAIDEYVTARMRLPHIPGLALAIVKDNQVLYLKGYGEADPSGHPVTPQTSFIIGSVTKAFTALAVMQLVEAGKVEPDAPVQRYIPWFRVADPVVSGRITVGQLLHQTSGLPMIREPQLWTGLDDRALERTVRFLQTAKVDFQPGQSFGYSNANYETLGLIVQVVSGQSYEEYVQQHIFAPLDMPNTFVSQEKAQQHTMASGYRWWFGIPIAATFHYNRSELPAGYIISSAADMAHFLIAQMNGGQYRNISILSPEGIDSTHTEPAPNTYGMGWESHLYNGRTLINHEGGTANFQCSVFFDPQERVGVFIAANVMCALDAFSSPHGSTQLDGSTVRAMAQTVLSMVTNRPLPRQGRGIRLLYIIFDLVVLALTFLLIISVRRIPAQYKKLGNGVATQRGLTWHISLVAVLHFAWPLVILYVALNVLFWKVLLMFQPDLCYWLEAVAVVVFIKGLVEIVLISRVFRQVHSRQPF